MEIPALLYGGDFDAANRLHARFERYRTNFRDRRHGVVIGHGHRGDTCGRRALDQLPRRAATIRCGGMEMKVNHLSSMLGVTQWISNYHRAPRAATDPRCARAASPSLALEKRAVLANEQVEMLALLVCEFQEDLLAFGILEALAVFLEEAVRAALAADADHEGLLVVDPAL